MGRISESPSQFRYMQLCHRGSQGAEVSPEMIQPWASEAYPQPKWEESGLRCPSSHPGRRTALTHMHPSVHLGRGQPSGKEHWMV